MAWHLASPTSKTLSPSLGACAAPISCEETFLYCVYLFFHEKMYCYIFLKCDVCAACACAISLCIALCCVCGLPSPSQSPPSSILIAQVHAAWFILHLHSQTSGRPNCNNHTNTHTKNKPFLIYAIRANVM